MELRSFTEIHGKCGLLQGQMDEVWRNYGWLYVQPWNLGSKLQKKTCGIWILPRNMDEHGFYQGTWMNNIQNLYSKGLEETRLFEQTSVRCNFIFVQSHFQLLCPIIIARIACGWNQGLYCKLASVPPPMCPRTWEAATSKRQPGCLEAFEPLCHVSGPTCHMHRTQIPKLRCSWCSCLAWYLASNSRQCIGIPHPFPIIAWFCAPLQHPWMAGIHIYHCLYQRLAVWSVVTTQFTSKYRWDF